MLRVCCKNQVCNYIATTCHGVLFCCFAGFGVGHDIVSVLKRSFTHSSTDSEYMIQRIATIVVPAQSQNNTYEYITIVFQQPYSSYFNLT